MVSWSTADAIPPGWSGPIHVTPSSSVCEILTVLGLSSVSSAAKTRLWKPRASVKPRSVKPMGSESTTTEDGAARLTQLEDWPLAGHVSLKVTNRVCRSDWKFATPVAQLLPTEGSPPLRPMYSTEFGCCPAEVVLTGTRTPGTTKFSYPILGPLSWGAGAGGTDASGTALAMP